MVNCDDVIKNYVMTKFSQWILFSESQQQHSALVTQQFSFKSILIPRIRKVSIICQYFDMNFIKHLVGNVTQFYTQKIIHKVNVLLVNELSLGFLKTQVNSTVVRSMQQFTFWQSFTLERKKSNLILFLLSATVMWAKIWWEIQQFGNSIPNTNIINLVEDLDIRPEILFSSAWSLFALLKGRANKDQNFLFVFHYSHSAQQFLKRTY